jgi:hypothetical protein
MIAPHDSTPAHARYLPVVYAGDTALLTFTLSAHFQTIIFADVFLELAMRVAFSILPILLLTAATPLLAAEQPSWTTGVAVQSNEGLIDCGPRSRASAVGTITAEDGTVWTVPADTRFLTGPVAMDLYNECGGDTLNSVDELDLKKVPVVDVDADASDENVFSAYVFADNYFELYVNGKLIGVDAVPFTPFNASVLRFRAKRPMTVAFKLVDWEERLGLGTERGRGSPMSVGDGGLVAVVKDIAGNTVKNTDASWRAQTFYVAPVVDRSCIRLAGATRDSSMCANQVVERAEKTSAAHWPLPNDWAQPGFDDSVWPNATVYSNDTVGVDNKRAFTNFVNVFDAANNDAEFIWSSNLLLDNLVLVRTTID